MTWIINVNSSLCRIYHYQKSPAQITLLKEIAHPKSRMKGEEITTDRPGHYQSGGSARGAYSPHQTVKETEAESFAREVAKELDLGRNQNKYDKVIIISPPHMSGLLLEHTDKHVKDLVINHIQKDLLHLKEHELLDFLKTHVQYPDS